jgi:hypothetical protein
MENHIAAKSAFGQKAIGKEKAIFFNRNLAPLLDYLFTSTGVHAS